LEIGGEKKEILKEGVELGTGNERKTIGAKRSRAYQANWGHGGQKKIRIEKS